tara:strand:+ start:3453 stop:3764 length:312 start_codon:yes stop_codon:yes gene_type:complete
MKYCFDLDETLCATPSSRKYDDAVPYYPVIDRVNQLHDEGHYITIYTARGGTSKINHNELTTSQLKRWGVWKRHIQEIVHEVDYNHPFGPNAYGSNRNSLIRG